MLNFQTWLFAMRESQQCLTMLKKIIKAPEEGLKDLDSDTQSESDAVEKKEKVYSNIMVKKKQCLLYFIIWFVDKIVPHHLL